MGLDITAYSGITKLNAHMNDDGEAVDNQTGKTLDWSAYCSPYVNPDFPEHAKSLEVSGVYGFEESFGFRAGSYGGYNQWRDALARMAGYAGGAQGAWDSDSGPFWELINFSDCEGSIDAPVCAKLAADFASFQTKADAYAASNTYFLELYASWRQAFEMAAKGGMVDFH